MEQKNLRIIGGCGLLLPPLGDWSLWYNVRAPLQAEPEAILQAVPLALNCNWKQVRISSDTIIGCRCTRESWSSPLGSGEVGSVTSDIRRYIGLLRRWKCSWVSRDPNGEAHNLAASYEQ